MLVYQRVSHGIIGFPVDFPKSRQGDDRSSVTSVLPRGQPLTPAAWEAFREREESLGTGELEWGYNLQYNPLESPMDRNGIFKYTIVHLLKGRSPGWLIRGLVPL